MCILMPLTAGNGTLTKMQHFRWSCQQLPAVQSHVSSAAVYAVCPPYRLASDAVPTRSWCAAKHIWHAANGRQVYLHISETG